MKKLITILLIGILIAGCSKEPTPTPEPLTYDYTGRVYAKTPKEGGLWTVYEFYSSDSASYTLRRDNWDGAVLGNVCKRGYTIGYVNEAPAITVKMNVSNEKNLHFIGLVPAVCGLQQRGRKAHTQNLRPRRARI